MVVVAVVLVVVVMMIVPRPKKKGSTASNARRRSRDRRWLHGHNQRHGSGSRFWVQDRFGAFAGGLIGLWLTRGRLRTRCIYYVHSPSLVSVQDFYQVSPALFLLLIAEYHCTYMAIQS